MHGTILFRDVETLAEFLRSFTGCTALFKVEGVHNGWLLTFTGGY